MTLSRNNKGRKGGNKSKKNSPTPPAPSSSGPVEKKEPEAPKEPDEHPFALGAIITARWMDESERFCDVIERDQVVYSKTYAIDLILLTFAF